VPSGLAGPVNLGSFVVALLAERRQQDDASVPRGPVQFGLVEAIEPLDDFVMRLYPSHEKHHRTFTMIAQALCFGPPGSESGTGVTCSLEKLAERARHWHCRATPSHVVRIKRIRYSAAEGFSSSPARSIRISIEADGVTEPVA
jgi:hypothetical protein